MLDGLDQRHAGRRVVEIADVLRYERFVAARDADGVLEVAAQREHRRAGREQLDRPRRVAAGAADELEVLPRLPRSDAQHAVVAAGDDGAVVHEQDDRRCRQAVCTASSLPVTSGSPPGFALVITRTRSCAVSQPGGARRAGRPLRGRAGSAEACTAASRPAKRGPVRRPAGVVGERRPLRMSTIGRSAEASSRLSAGDHVGEARAAKRRSRPSPRRAFPRALCARAGVPQPRRCARRRRDGTRPGP